jgi:predicted PurR-regulated permease PerM
MNDSMQSARSVLLWTAAAALVALWALRDLALIVGFAVLLAYALNPVASFLQRARVGRVGPLSRGVASALVMLALVGAAGGLLAFALPHLVAEAGRLAVAAPDAAGRLVAAARNVAAAHGMSPYLEPALDSVRANAATLLQNLGSVLARGASRMLGGLGEVLSLALVPLLAFYLLADAEAVRASALRFVPASARGELQRLGSAVDRALGGYVRGQAAVCLVMGASVGLALVVLKLPFALLLGVLVGLAELIPYVGFAVAAIAIVLTGFSVGPMTALAGAVAYAAINWVVGTFVTPRIMGRYLQMHPFVATVSVLAGAKLFGPAGALLALPAAAVAQAVVAELAPAADPG